MEANKFYEKIEVSDQEILLKMTIPVEAFEESYTLLLKQRSQSSDIKGFRKGKVPQALVEPSLESLILTETFERIAPYYVNAAIIKESLFPIAPPEYTDLKELKRGQPIAFTVKITIMPKFKLGKLSKIKLTKQSTEATPAEIEKTLENMFQSNQSKVKAKKMDDTWAKEISKLYKFEEIKTLEDLRKEIAKVIVAQKSVYSERIATAEAIKQAVELSQIKIPEAAIEYEAREREEAFKKDVKAMNISIADFCKRQGIKFEDLKIMWKKDSLEALESDALFKTYADHNKIEVQEDELNAEIEKLKKADKARYEELHKGHDHDSRFNEEVYNDEDWRSRISTVILKQKAYNEFVKKIVAPQISSGEKSKASGKK